MIRPQSSTGEKQGRCQELLKETMVFWSRVEEVEVVRNGYTKCVFKIEPSGLADWWNEGWERRGFGHEHLEERSWHY